MASSSAPTSGARPISIYTMRTANKASSSIGSYEGIVKFVIRKRMTRVLVLSGLFAWSAMNLLVWSPRNGVMSEIIANFLPSNLFILLLTYALSTIPSFILLRLSLRSEYSHPSTIVYPTLASRLWGLLNPSASTSLASRLLSLVNPFSWSLSNPSLALFVSVYALQGWVLAFGYCVLAGVREWDDPKLAVFAPSLRHRFLLNERFVFLTLSNMSVGIICALRTKVLSNSLGSWPSFTTRPPHRPNFVPAVGTSAVSILTLSAASSIVFTISYSMLRLRTWRTILYIFPFLRSYMGSFARARHSPITLGLTWRGLALNIASATIWEFMRVLLDVYSTEPIVMSSFASDSNATLLSGITSKDPYVQHHAFHELAVLAQTSSSDASGRRKALLSDLKTPAASQNAPTNGTVPYATTGAWAVLLREALLVLGRDYQTLLGRGVPPSPPPSAAPVPAPSREPETPAKKPTVNVKTGGASLFKPVPVTPATTRSRILDSFSSEGASTTVLSGLVESAAAIPSIFLGEGPHGGPSSSKSTGIVAAAPKAVTASPSAMIEGVKSLSVSVSEARKKVGSGVQSLEQKALAMLPEPVRWKVMDLRWALVGSSRQKVECALRRRKMDLWIVEGLSYLTAHSLEEDAYGVVQRDVPRVIEALLSYSSALEAYAIEVEKLTSSAAAADTGDEKDPEMKKYIESRRLSESEAIGELIGPLLTGLRSGVKLITGAFGVRLEAFKFSPTTAEQLQALIDP